VQVVSPLSFIFQHAFLIAAVPAIDSNLAAEVKLILWKHAVYDIFTVFTDLIVQAPFN
jgi:hypothetical protein